MITFSSPNFNFVSAVTLFARHNQISLSIPLDILTKDINLSITPTPLLLIAMRLLAHGLFYSVSDPSLRLPTALYRSRDLSFSNSRIERVVPGHRGVQLEYNISPTETKPLSASLLYISDVHASLPGTVALSTTECKLTPLPLHGLPPARVCRHAVV